MSFNKVIIVGNLGRDPELRYTPQGTAVANFSMATTEKRQNEDDITTWFKVTLWGARAEVAAKYLTKGSQVYIEGRLKIQEWTDRDDNNRYTLEVTATDMQFIGSGSRREDNPAGEYAGGEDTAGDERMPVPVPKAKTKAAAAGKGKGKKAADATTVSAIGDDDIPF